MEAADGQGHPSAHSPPTQRPKDNGKKTCVRNPRHCKTNLLQQSRKRDRPCVRIKRPRSPRERTPPARSSVSCRGLLRPQRFRGDRPAKTSLHHLHHATGGGTGNDGCPPHPEALSSDEKSVFGEDGGVWGKALFPPEKGPSPSNPSRLSPDSPQGTHEIAYPHFAVVVPARLGKTHMPAVRGHLQAQDRAFFRDGNRVAGR